LVRWQSYLRQIDIDDTFLSRFSPEDRWDVLVEKMGEFRVASAKAWFKERSKTPSAQWHFIILRTLKGLKGDDHPPRKQAPATPELVRLLAFSAESVPVDNTIVKLASGAYFFTKCSCEYQKVSGKRKTKLVLLEDIQFHIANRNL
jgi:hypothetical protein